MLSGRTNTLKRLTRKGYLLRRPARWDPIDGFVEDERSNYVDIINLFLMLNEEANEDISVADENPISNNSSAQTKNGTKKSRKNGSVEKANVETKAHMRKRLQEGV